MWYFKPRKLNIPVNNAQDKLDLCNNYNNLFFKEKSDYSGMDIAF